MFVYRLRLITECLPSCFLPSQPVDAETQKAMMAMYYKKQEEQKVRGQGNGFMSEGLGSLARPSFGGLWAPNQPSPSVCHSSAVAASLQGNNWGIDCPQIMISQQQKIMQPHS